MRSTQQDVLTNLLKTLGALRATHWLICCEEKGMAMQESSWWQNRRGEWWVSIQGIFMGAIALAPLAPRDVSLPAVLRPVGYLLLVVGSLVGVAGLRALGRNLTPYPRPIPDGQLVQSGIYRVVRHPIYSGISLGGLGWALWAQSGLSLLMALLFFAFLDRKAAREERWLREQYDEYAAYQRRVKRLIPWLW